MTRLLSLTLSAALASPQALWAANNAQVPARTAPSSPLQGAAAMLQGLLSSPAPLAPTALPTDLGLAPMDPPAAAAGAVMAEVPAAMALPAAEAVVTQEEREKIGLLLRHSRADGAAPAPEDGPAQNLRTLDAFRETFGTTQAADIERLAQESPAQLDALLLKMWSGARKGAPEPSLAAAADVPSPSRSRLAPSAPAPALPKEQVPGPDAARDPPAPKPFARLRNAFGALVSALFPPKAAAGPDSELLEQGDRSERVAVLDRVREEIERELAGLQGLSQGAARPKWPEREAIALFSAYSKLDWAAAARFYEDVFAARRAPRVPAAVHSDYVLALNRLGRVNEAISETRRGLADKKRGRFLSVPPQAWPFIEEEYLIALGTAHKNRYAARDELLESLRLLRRGDGRADLPRIVGFVLDYLTDAAGDPREWREAFPSLYAADGRLLTRAGVDQGAFAQDLAALLEEGRFEAWAGELESANAEDLKAALAYYERAYLGSFSQYAGSNVIRILVYMSGEANLRRAKDLVVLVRQSSRHGNQESFWPNAAQLELELLEEGPGHEQRAARLVAKLVRLGRRIPLERASLLAHLNRWLALKVERGESASSIALLAKAIADIKAQRSDQSSPDPRNGFTRAFDDSVVSLANVTRIVSAENNLRFNGIVPPSMVDFADLGILDEVMAAAKTRSGDPVFGADPAEVREWAKDFLARVYGLVDENGDRVMEDLASGPHFRAFDRLLPGMKEFAGSDMTKVGATNIVASMLLGLADCRFTNFTYPIMLNRWLQHQRRGLMRRIYALTPEQRAGAEGRRLLAELRELGKTDYVFMQAGFNMGVALGPKGKYDFARDADGRLIVDGKPKVVEDHTFTLRVTRDDDGNVERVWFDDVWYHEFYDMKSKPVAMDREAFAKAPRGERKFTMPMRVQIRPKTAAGPAEYRTLDVTFEVSKYSNPEVVITPNRYSASDLHLLGFVVKPPADLAAVLADPARLEAWKRLREERLYAMLLDRSRAPATVPYPADMPAATRDAVTRYPLAHYFMNGFAVYSEDGAPPRNLWQAHLDESLQRLARMERIRAATQGSTP